MNPATQRLGHADRHWNVSSSWTLRREVNVSIIWNIWTSFEPLSPKASHSLLQSLSPFLRPAFACVPSRHVCLPACWFAYLFACLLTIILAHGVPIGNASFEARACFFDVFLKTRCPLQKDKTQWLCHDLVAARCPMGKCCAGPFCYDFRFQLYWLP